MALKNMFEVAHVPIDVNAQEKPQKQLLTDVL